MKRDIFLYLSGPITANDGYTIEENVASAVKVYLECLRRGFPCFCPHLSAAFPSAFELEYSVWLDYDYAVIARCTHLLMLPRWETSKGARLELSYAGTIHKPVRYSLDELERELVEAGAW